MNPYPSETLADYEDDGTMPENVATLAEAVVGHRIVAVREGESKWSTTLVLDNGQQVILSNTNDCCAGTELEKFLLHPDRVDHVIAGVGTTDGYTTWHIYADAGDVLELTVGWSPGNPFYYMYGFQINIEETP